MYFRKDSSVNIPLSSLNGPKQSYHKAFVFSCDSDRLNPEEDEKEQAAMVYQLWSNNLDNLHSYFGEMAEKDPNNKHRFICRYCIPDKGPIVVGYRDSLRKHLESKTYDSKIPFSRIVCSQGKVAPCF